VSLEAAIEKVVSGAVERALAPYLRRLADPEPLVYSVPETAHVLRTSTTTVRRLIDEGVLPTVPHMGQRLVVPRQAVVRLVNAADVAPEQSLRLTQTQVPSVAAGR
jgi:excisionase family DNA binding protein